MKWVHGFLWTLLPPLIVFVAVAGLFELIVWTWQIPPFLLPAPSAVFTAMVDRRADLFGSLLSTAEAAGLGFLLSAMAGILIAIILSTSRLVQRAFYPYTVFFQTVPIVAIAPLLGIWCGFGRNSVALSAMIASIFPVIANTLTGLLSTDPALRDMFRLYKAGRISTLYKLRLPSALPNIITGLRIAAGLAVIGAIVGEFVAGIIDRTAGLGILVMIGIKNGNTDVVFAAVLLASLLGLAMLWIINGIGWYALRRWHASEKD